MRDGKIIYIKFISTDKKFSCTFNDSYKILQSAQRVLTKAYGIKTKYFFTRDFFNSIKSLTYVGPKPAKYLFENISDAEYSAIPDHYDINSELEIYLRVDCESLFNLLQIFCNNIAIKLKVNPLQYPTTHRERWGVFRTNYLKKYKIPFLTDNIYQNIYSAYYGGLVDVYKPRGSN